MTDSIRRPLQGVLAVATVVTLVTALSALAVVRAENRPRDLVAAEPGQPTDDTTGATFAPGTEDTTAGGTTDATTGDRTPASPAPGTQGGGGGGTGTPATAPPRTGGGSATGGGGGGGTGGGGGGQAAGQPGTPAGGTSCPDYNPDQGVHCDRILVGGTTVLSGPLAIYGEQGLRGGQAWIQYFNSVIAPQEGLRKVQLVYYDDGLDPNRTLQFTQRLVEVDKVLIIGGVTSPAAIADYIEQKGVPFIGDIGLNARSYTSSAIFPTAVPVDVRGLLRTKEAVEAAGIETMAVINGLLPGDNAAAYERSWRLGAEHFGVEITTYSDISQEANDCGGRMLEALRSQPDWIMLPAGAPPMLACMREAATQQARPGSPTSPFLENWSGGSNLQFEVDQCGQQCYGMRSAGTPFLDPRTNPSPEAKTYLQNMAKYFPGIDVTGFITINYYQAGWLQYQVMKQAGILHSLSRQAVMEAADGFGPFDTGFGNTVEWKEGQIPRIPDLCAYPVTLEPEPQPHWQFGTEPICVPESLAREVSAS